VILTVTLNAAIDKTYSIDNFAIDRVHRPTSWEIVPGGKGINVARVYKELGGSAVATGFVGGHNGDFIVDGLRKEGLQHDFVRTAGESRVCIAVVDHTQRTQTEVNEIGPQVTPDEMDRLLLKFESLVQGMEYAVLSGSIPPGVPETIYKDLAAVCAKYGVRCVLDASGKALANGIEALPYMVKPNIHELSALLGRSVGTVEEAAEAAAQYVQKGVKIFVVTFGRDGAVVADSTGVYRAKAPAIQFVSAVGSGDSFVSAFIFALQSGQPVSEALRLGTAAGAANAATYGAGFCKKEEILRLADEVELCRLDEVSI
jgi:1-phosphofructokinase family hexose kinase